MKRIVLLVGGVETLAYFSIQMGNEWKRMGYKVFYFDLEDEMSSAKKLRRFIKPGETVLVTFNFEGLEKEAGVYREGIGYVWDEYAVPCYNIAVDHPYYYHERLADLPEKYYHISIDRLHEAYFKHFYPEFTHRGFLPLAGSKLEELCMPMMRSAARPMESISSVGEKRPSSVSGMNSRSAKPTHMMPMAA